MRGWEAAIHWRGRTVAGLVAGDIEGADGAKERFHARGWRRREVVGNVIEFEPLVTGLVFSLDLVIDGL
jgi:hypothetical protein